MTDHIDSIIAKLTEFDRDVLRTACGDDRLIGWGAATSCAMEFLAGLHLTRSESDARPTDLGKQVAARLQAADALDDAQNAVRVAKQATGED